jgi:hypothetical protein
VSPALAQGLGSERFAACLSRWTRRAVFSICLGAAFALPHSFASAGGSAPVHRRAAVIRRVLTVPQALAQCDPRRSRHRYYRVRVQGYFVQRPAVHGPDLQGALLRARSTTTIPPGGELWPPDGGLYTIVLVYQHGFPIDKWVLMRGRLDCSGPIFLVTSWRDV